MHPDDEKAGAPADRQVIFRLARREDVPSVVRLLADDALGSGRERYAEPLPQAYWEAFNAITARPDNELIVADIDGAVVGCLQLSFIPGLSRTGMWRGQIESVRVADGQRGSGLGSALIEWAVERAVERGCGLVQLTSDKARPDAIRFYEKLGFVSSHEGLKRNLP